MKNLATVILGVIIILVLFAFMVTFQVDFHEIAVVDTFGDVEEGSVYYGQPRDEGSSGRLLGNLYFKWPVPIQRVHTYDARVQALETRLESLQTADEQAVIPAMFVAWRIDKPVDFYVSLRDARRAVGMLESRLRDQSKVIASYALTELTNPDPAQLKLNDAERRIRDNIQRDLDEQGYGIRIEAVAIKRLILPEPVTEQVFTQMRETRERLAQRARSEGTSTAAKIRSDAESTRRVIMSFANRRADEIRAEAAAALADIYAQFKTDEEFAQFLNKIDALREMLARQATIIADPDMVPFDEFKRQQAPSR